MNGKEFIRELEEAMLKIELSNKRILFMHPEDIAILDLDKVSNAIYLVEERRLEHGRMVILVIRIIFTIKVSRVNFWLMKIRFASIQDCMTRTERKSLRVIY